MIKKKPPFIYAKKEYLSLARVSCLAKIYVYILHRSCRSIIGVYVSSQPPFASSSVCPDPLVSHKPIPKNTRTAHALQRVTDKLSNWRASDS